MAHKRDITFNQLMLRDYQDRQEILDEIKKYNNIQSVFLI